MNMISPSAVCQGPQNFCWIICCFCIHLTGVQTMIPWFHPKKAGAIALMLASLLHFRYRDYFITATNHILPYPSISQQIVTKCHFTLGLYGACSCFVFYLLIRKITCPETQRDARASCLEVPLRVQRCSGTCGLGDFFGTPEYRYIERVP